MKRKHAVNYEKSKEKQWKKEHSAGGFKCGHCKRWVVINEYIGTANRNHCNICLWSKHVDEKKGDRRALCGAGMEPIGLTFKAEGWGKQGEVMLVHACAGCGKLSINRIAGDDMEMEITDTFRRSLVLDMAIKRRIEKTGIAMLDEGDETELHVQLFGK